MKSLFDKKFIDVVISAKKCKEFNGVYGLNSCKDRIREIIKTSQDFDAFPVTLFDLLKEYYYKVNFDCFFNINMLYACILLINELYDI